MIQQLLLPLTVIRLYSTLQQSLYPEGQTVCPQQSLLAQLCKIPSGSCLPVAFPWSCKQDWKICTPAGSLPTAVTSRAFSLRAIALTCTCSLTLKQEYVYKYTHKGCLPEKITLIHHVGTENNSRFLTRIYQITFFVHKFMAQKSNSNSVSQRSYQLHMKARILLHLMHNSTHITKAEH